MSIALDAALSGLRVAQQQISTISANISNASTPGYTKKTLPQSSQTINGQAVGVTSATLTRVVNETLLHDINQQNSVAAYASIQQSYFLQIQNLQGSPTGGTSLPDHITSLKNAFTQLSQSPNDGTLQAQALAAAQQTAGQINRFANLLNSMRAQTESDIAANIKVVNNDLNIIAQLNLQITSLAAQGQNTADLEDKRDAAINDVSKYLKISTSTNGLSITVLTSSGQVLADAAAAQTLYFSPSNMLPTTYYPGGGLSGITVGSPTGTDITAQGSLGGQLGGLFDLRDQILPKYSAQLDEFSENLALRFDEEGLTLFTDRSGNIPANVAGSYVGFSSYIQVNPAVTADPTLIQKGTTGTEPANSSEVINRITQYTFGNYKSQQASGTVDVSDTLQPFSNLFLPPLTTNNNITGTVNLATYADFSTLPGDTLGLPDSFDVTFGALGTQTITVNTTDTADSLVAQINAAFGSNIASINGQGQLAFNYAGDITLLDNGDVLPALGLTAGTTLMPEPRFQVQIGTNPPVTISIAATDTTTEVLAKLNAVPGLTASLDGNGFMVMTPTNGGALGAIDVLGGPLAAMGVTISNVPFSSFRQNNLGPGGTISTGLLANSTLQDYISSSISDQSEAANLNQLRSTQETSYLNTLKVQNANLTGVSIDEEMTRLIQIQSAYAAAAKMISATQKIFDDLLAAFPN